MLPRLAFANNSSRTGDAKAAATSQLVPQKANDILDLAHDRRRKHTGARRAVGENAVDLLGVGEEPRHFGIDRADARHRQKPNRRAG